MRITEAIETPEEFTSRAADALKAATTHIYFDTSFLMWLTRLGEEARTQFKAWANKHAGRIHIPLWSMHEYYRHHASGTLRADLVNRANELMAAAKAFQQEVRKYGDQTLIAGQSEAAYQDAVDNTLIALNELSNAAKNWDYDSCASDVIAWMNLHALEQPTVFKAMSTLEAKGAARYTQDVPPGFLDRRKEDRPTRGSNKYGDLLFWEEVVEHARTAEAVTVVVVTRDRKEDWFAATAEPLIANDWQRVRAKWLPVPDPHPTLAFELKTANGAKLILLDELYLGAILWKFGRPDFERLAAAAIAVSPGHFDSVAPIPRTAATRSQKRRDQATFGLVAAGGLLDAALGEPSPRVAALLGLLNQDAPDVDESIEQLGVETLEPLTPGEISNFAKQLHDKGRATPGPAATATGKLLDRTDAMPADMAAASYLGFLCSAYFDGSIPATRPVSPFLEDLFAWRLDPAMHGVLRAFNFRLKQRKSPALYIPSSGEEKILITFEHDVEQHQNPALLTQIYVHQKGVLVDGEAIHDNRLVSYLSSPATTIREIARALSRYYGLPFDLLDYRGADPDDVRLVAELTGLREFSRFESDQPAPEETVVTANETLSEQVDVDEDEDGDLEED